MTATISSSLISPEANVSEQSRMEFQAKLNGIGNLQGKQVSPEVKAKKLREACEGFESIFIQKMWQEMRNTIPKNGMLHGREERFWQDMYDQELSKSMTSAGGIGLADMMYEQLSRNLISATRSAVGQGSYSAFTPTAAPLIVEGQSEEVSHEAPGQKVASASSIYDGEAAQTGASRDDGQPEQGKAENPERLIAQEVVQPGVNVAAQAVAINNVQAVEKKPAKEKTQKLQHTDRHIVNRGINQNNGLDLSYIARRDAGDKLGKGAVRPALRPKDHRDVESQEVAQQAPQSNVSQIGFSQAGNLQPGTAEGLRAAVEMAKSGATGIQSGNLGLDNIVSSVKAQNMQNQQATQNVAQNVENKAENNQPVITKVQYTTNIPQKNKSKNSGPAIRMLNTENKGVNSKAGQGLAAYHAAQEAQAKQAEVQTKAAEAQAGQNIPPISPLTAKSNEVENVSAPASFAIPPLKSPDLKG